MSLKTFLFSLVAIMALFFTSCDKEEVTTDSKKASFMANISGVDWKADTCFSVMNYDSNTIELIGISDGREVRMSLLGVSKGYFNLDDFENNLTMKTITSEYQYLPGSGGGVELTLNDKVDFSLSGNFSGMLIDTLLDTIMIKDGIFKNCTYLDTTTNVGPGGIGGGGVGSCTSNELIATVDGTAFSGAVSANLFSGIILIQSIDNGSASVIQIALPDDASTGSHDVDGVSYSGTYTVGADAFIGESGSIVIDEHDVANKSIKGSFSFAGKNSTGDSKDIAGTFCVTY